MHIFLTPKLIIKAECFSPWSRWYWVFRSVLGITGVHVLIRSKHEEIVVYEKIQIMARSTIITTSIVQRSYIGLHYRVVYYLRAINIRTDALQLIIVGARIHGKMAAFYLFIYLKY